jgi:lantibiotic modifying enzyme
MTADRSNAEDLGHAALQWLLSQAQSSGEAVAWSAFPGGEEPDPTLYSGGAGIVLALVEGHRHFGDERYAEAAIRGGRGIADAVERWDHSGLYFGLTGMAFALQSLAAEYAVEELRQSARRALDHVRSRFDGVRWSAQVELLAGIALGALAMGEVDLAVTA